MTHTREPWHLNGYAYKEDTAAPTGRRVFICAPDSGLCEGYTINAANHEVAHIRSHRGLSDARLIAAAPDLLAMLQAIADTFEIAVDEAEARRGKINRDDRELLRSWRPFSCAWRGMAGNDSADNRHAGD